MIRGGFLIEEDRKALIALARDGLAAGRVTRRANALVLLDKGMSCHFPPNTKIATGLVDMDVVLGALQEPCAAVTSTYGSLGMEAGASPCGSLHRCRTLDLLP
jgi:hypothetical protein